MDIKTIYIIESFDLSLWKKFIIGAAVEEKDAKQFCHQHSNPNIVYTYFQRPQIKCR